MNLEYCQRCGKLYAKNFREVCQNCIKDIDREYDRCVAYLKDRENRKSNIHQLSEATDVSVRQIAKFIREGRISIVQLPNMEYPCDSCGGPIREGNICSTCRVKLAKEVSGLAEDERKRMEAANKKEFEGAYRAANRLRDL